jgi:hypothetical protein
MSRAQATDVSSPISLFPFIGVLLCTMGALLVVLIAVSPSAREVALRQSPVRSKSAAAETSLREREKLDKLNSYIARLDQVRTEAEQKLRDDQLRLEHLETHMRSLQNQLQSLQIAAAELHALEEEHYDDREQAEREIERLQQLIGQMRDAISSIRAEQKTKKRSYALVPYEGSNGTFRRPIYIECRNDEVVLQPEGVRITLDDLQPPLGPGNALAAAVRAARVRLLQLHPEEGKYRDTEPYPLLIMRPSGVSIFGRAQRAIQEGDFDFGYELVEEEWDLKFPTPDPQLAIAAQQAVEQARIRQHALAAAAPRAYRHPGLAAAGRFDYQDAADGPFAIVERAGSASAGDHDSLGGGSGGGGAPATGGGAADAGATGTRGAASDNGPNRATGASGADQYDPHASQHSGDSGTSGVGNQQQANANNSAAPDSPNGYPGGPLPNGVGPKSAASGSPNPPPPPGSTVNQNQGNGGTSVTYGNSSPAGSNTIPQGVDYSEMPMDLAKTRGNDWALKRKGGRSVPIRRPIRVVVRGDRITILSDDPAPISHKPTERTVMLRQATVESIEELVTAIDSQIDGWGTAGDGMYWRPVLQLHVAPDGARRFQDLSRLLKNSGLELETPATAITSPRGNTRATTR